MQNFDCVLDLLFKQCEYLFDIFSQLHNGQYNDSATTDNALCGTSTPLPMETTTSILFVEFFSNTQFAARGFRAKYSFNKGEDARAYD